MSLAGKSCASVDEPVRGWFNFTATRYEEPTSKSKLTVRRYEDRPVGCPPGSDPVAMTKEEREAHRDTVERLKELVEKAAKGDKNPLPEIRKILKESPDLSWQLMDFAKYTES